MGPVRRGKCVELSHAHVRSLGELGTGILGNVSVLNGPSLLPHQQSLHYI
jgi:hypothetical protein